MKVLFVDSDPVMRGLMHCMATMADLEHAIVPSGQAALAMLRGESPHRGASWSVDTSIGRSIGLVIVELDLPDMHGLDLGAILRVEFPEVGLMAHTSPACTEGTELFDEVYFKPHSAEDVIRAALRTVAGPVEWRLFGTLIPFVEASAA